MQVPATSRRSPATRRGVSPHQSGVHVPGDDPIMRPVSMALVLAVAMFARGSPADATVVHADSGDFLLDAVTAVEDPPDATPMVTRLAAINPNPFNPSTTIVFDLAQAGPVELAIFDLRGRLVDVLASGSLEAGRHHAVWDGRHCIGQSMPSGTYCCRLVAGGSVQSLKLVLAK